jgi:hypothetical protein
MCKKVMKTLQPIAVQVLADTKLSSGDGNIQKNVVEIQQNSNRRLKFLCIKNLNFPIAHKSVAQLSCQLKACMPFSDGNRFGQIDATDRCKIHLPILAE